MSIKLFKVVNTEGAMVDWRGNIWTKDFLEDPSNKCSPNFINPSQMLRIRQYWKHINSVDGVSTEETKMQGKEYPDLEIEYPKGTLHFLGTLEELQICMANPNNYIELVFPK